MQTFELRIGKHKIKITQYYESEQVQRFRIEIKEKFVLLEKRILKKPYRWKLIGQSMNVDVKKLLINLEDIKQNIDRLMNPRESHGEYFRRTKR